MVYLSLEKAGGQPSYPKCFFLCSPLEGVLLYEASIRKLVIWIMGHPLASSDLSPQLKQIGRRVLHFEIPMLRVLLFNKTLWSVHKSGMTERWKKGFRCLPFISLQDFCFHTSNKLFFFCKHWSLDSEWGKANGKIWAIRSSYFGAKAKGSVHSPTPIYQCALEDEATLRAEGWSLPWPRMLHQPSLFWGTHRHLPRRLGCHLLRCGFPHLSPSPRVQRGKVTQPSNRRKPP